MEDSATEDSDWEYDELSRYLINNESKKVAKRKRWGNVWRKAKKRIFKEPKLLKLTLSLSCFVVFGLISNVFYKYYRNLTPFDIISEADLFNA